jgi:DNA-binding IclR family transcriptional regulator
MEKSHLKTSSVPALEKGMSLLEMLAESKRGLTLSELVRKTKLPKSTIHCLVLTLERQGYLRECPRTRRFLFSSKLFHLANRASTQVEIRQTATRHLYDLMLETNLTVHLAVMEQDQVVLIEKVEPPGVLKVANWIGRRMDIHCTGLGKALIAHLDDTELDRLMKECQLPRHNEHTIISPKALRSHLAEIRKLKYALDDEEDELGLRCVGAPIFDHAGKVLAAVSICGSTCRIHANNLSTLAHKLNRTATEISRNLFPVSPEQYHSFDRNSNSYPATETATD